LRWLRRAIAVPAVARKNGQNWVGHYLAKAWTLSYTTADSARDRLYERDRGMKRVKLLLQLGDN